MPTTRAQSVTKVRRILNDWYRDNDTTAGSATAIATSFTATNGTLYSPGDNIQIGDEVMVVRTIDSNVLTVRRGHLGTTKAIFASGADVDIATPGLLTDHEVEGYIADAEEYMFPFLGKEFEGSIRGSAMIVLDEMDATTGWTGTGEVANPTLNTTDQQEGSGCLDYAFNHSSTGSGRLHKVIGAVDARPYSYVNLFVYVKEFEDSSSDNTIKKDWAFDVQVGTDKTNYKNHRVSTKEVGTNWNLLSIPVADMIDVGTVEMSATTHIGLKTYADQSIAAGDLKIDAAWMTTYPVIKTGYQRYKNPKNVYNVRGMSINGNEEVRFHADKDYFTLQDGAVADNAIGDYVIVRGMQRPEPSTDNLNLDIDSDHDELFHLYAAQKGIEAKLAPRTNFASFSGRRNVADITTAEIITTKNDILRRIQALENKLESPGQGMGK